MSAAEWRWARIGVCPMSAKGKMGAGSIPVVPNPFERFTCELFAYCGLLVEWLTPSELASKVDSLDVLITIGDRALSEEEGAALRAFVQGGGVWIALGGVCALPELFGVRPLSHAGDLPVLLGEGYAVATGSNPLLLEEWGMLHAFGGIGVEVEGATVWAHWLDAHARETDYPALLYHRYGEGHTILFAVHPGESIARIRQGRCVVEAAIPPPDVPREPHYSTLHMDDAIRLDWYLDREPCEGERCFLKPVADLWQESLIRAVLWAGQGRGAVVPMLWFYPSHLPGAAILSIDGEPATAQQELTLQRVLTLVGLRAVWCLSEATHGPAFYRELAKRGHEIGLRYVPEAGAFCRATTLQNQVDSLRRFSGVRAITALQVADLHWRGGTEFYAYMEQAQILSDLSRGGSSASAAGFAFGSAHPWRPLHCSRPGELYAVQVVPLLGYQVMDRVSPARMQAILRRARAVNGVCHFTVRPNVVESEARVDAFARLIAAVRTEGYEWVTAAELARWHAARAAIRHRLAGIAGQLRLALLAPAALNRLTVLLFTPLRGWARSGSGEIPVKPAEQFGYPCLMLETDLVEKSVREIDLFATHPASAAS